MHRKPHPTHPARPTHTVAPSTVALTPTVVPTTVAPTTVAPAQTHVAAPPTHAVPVAPTTTAASNCDPSYPGSCLHDGVGDYDCAGGSGNGPNYVDGPITVLPPDPFGLDSDHDGVGCES